MTGTNLVESVQCLEIIANQAYEFPDELKPYLNILLLDGGFGS